MKNDFIRIYSAIDIKEQVAFQQYVQFFYSGQKIVLSVFDEIIKVASITEEKEKEAAFYAIRKKVEGKDPEKMREQKNRLNAFDDLKKWLLDFLALQEIQENGIEAQFLKLEALRKRKLIDAFQDKSKKLMLELAKPKNPSLFHLFWQVRLSHLDYFNIPIDRLQDYQPKLLDLIQSLDDFYISAKLQYSAELHSRSTILQDRYDNILLDDLLKMLNNHKRLNKSVKEIYLPMLDLTKNQSEQAYALLKQFLIENPQHDFLERQAILIYLLNFTTSRLRIGDDSMILESFDLYQLGIHQSLFIVSGYFLTTTFINIVNTACRLEKYVWVENFVNQFKIELPPSEKEETTLLANARIAFDKIKYEQVISMLYNVDSKNIKFELNIRSLRLRAYYEMYQKGIYTHDFVHADNENFYFYVLRSKKIGNSMQQNALNFYKMYRSLLSKKKSKEQLFKELAEKSNAMICYDWIKMKIEESSNQT